MGHSIAVAGRMMPPPITAAVRTTVTTTITSTVADWAGLHFVHRSTCTDHGPLKWEEEGAGGACPLQYLWGPSMLLARPGKC